MKTDESVGEMSKWSPPRQSEHCELVATNKMLPKERHLPNTVPYFLRMRWLPVNTVAG